MLTNHQRPPKKVLLPPPLPFSLISGSAWHMRYRDMKRRILDSPQLILALNWSGWYSASSCLHKEILFLIMPCHTTCYPRLRCHPTMKSTSPPPLEQDLLHWVCAALISTNMLLLEPAHTQVSLGQPWRVQKERKRCRGHTLRKQKRVTENPRDICCRNIRMEKALWNAWKGEKEQQQQEQQQRWFRECPLWTKHTAHVCFSWGRVVTRRLLSKTNRRARMPSSSEELKMWFAYIVCGVTLNFMYFMSARWTGLIRVLQKR